MTSTFECTPGLVPRLLNCDDCQSWVCALTSILVVLVGIAVVIGVAHLSLNRPNASKVKRR